MIEYVSQREFARRMGCSHVWINQLIREGKIPVNEKKRIPFEAGREAFEASKQPGYDANRAHGEKQREAAKKKRGATSKAQPRKTSKPTDDDAPLPEAPMDAASAATVAQVNVAYNKARLAEKTYQAKLKEIEFKEASGQLVPIEQVRADAARTGAEVREKLSSVGARVANICEGKSAREIEGIVDDAINDALAALRKSKFVEG